MDKISSENQILELIHKYFPNSHPNLNLARGDDCALFTVNQKECLAITTDIFQENIHFRKEYFPLDSIGYKALAVNISDILAMGGKPLFFQLALSLPKDFSGFELEKILEGMAKLANTQEIALAGGDLSKGSELCISVTLIGKIPQNKPLYRGNNTIGDMVGLIGAIGLSRLALEVLENKEKKERYTQSLMAHFYPKILAEESEKLVHFAKEHPHENFSLMDVSDGLMEDLPRLVPNFGIAINMDIHELHEEVICYSKEKNVDPLEFALKGGEDYALLFTCPQKLWAKLENSIPIVKVGQVIGEKGLFLNGNKLNFSSFDHWKE